MEDAKDIRFSMDCVTPVREAYPRQQLVKCLNKMHAIGDAGAGETFVSTLIARPYCSVTVRVLPQRGTLTGHRTGNAHLAAS